MVKGAEGWNSFWDVATPEQAARELITSAGAGAADAAISCADAAQRDNRDADFRFWMAVFRIVKASALNNETGGSDGAAKKPLHH